jgi:hypothetical protein
MEEWTKVGEWKKPGYLGPLGCVAKNAREIEGFQEGPRGPVGPLGTIGQRTPSRSENKITLNRKELPHLQCLGKILGDFQQFARRAVRALEGRYSGEGVGLLRGLIR